MLKGFLPDKENQVASKRVQKFAALMDSDSDSYGSEGKLKEKPKEEPKIKKRGGKKRAKGAKGDDPEANADDKYTNDRHPNQEAESQNDLKMNVSISPKREEPVKEKPIKYEVKDESGSDTESVHLGESIANEPKHQQSPYIAKKRHESPPMIKEFDPNEENAKTRAKRRKEELIKREQVPEVDMQQYPDDPTPWKGRPSDFFILHNPKRGTHKILNNSQKEFLLIYYPECVADRISMMEFLHKQAKAHEEKRRKIQEDRQNLIMRVAKKQKNNRKMPAPRYVQEIVHVNQDLRERENSFIPVNFDSLLHETKQTQQANMQLQKIRSQIESIQKSAAKNYAEAQNMQMQHSETVSMGGSNAVGHSYAGIEPEDGHRMASSATADPGYCLHCHNHLNGGAAMTLNDENTIQRQRIMQQICEAKKRQARMEAEEARRLRDEARRLADAAKILDLEAQRPLMEAKRLEEEAAKMEQEFMRVPKHNTARENPVQDKMGYGANSVGPRQQQQNMNEHNQMTQQRASVIDRRDQLIQEAQRAQAEIQRLRNMTVELVKHSESDKVNTAGQELYDHHTFPSQNRQEIHSTSVEDRKAIAVENAFLYKMKAKKEKQERESRIEIEKANQEAANAKVELARLQAAQAKRDLEAAKKAIANRAKDEVKAKQKAKNIEPVYDDYDPEQDHSDEEQYNSENDFDSAGAKSEKSHQSYVSIQPLPLPEEQVNLKKPKKVKASPSKLEKESYDPILSAADEEFYEAKKLFERAQKAKDDAHKKQEKIIKAQVTDIEKAQKEATRYFEELKQKDLKDDPEKKVKKGKNLQHLQNQSHLEEQEQENLLRSFDNYMDRISNDSKKLADRYHNRDQIYEFLAPILSGHIIREFDDHGGYINFDQYALNDNFNNGHQEYFHKWRHLFLYETYCFMMNSRFSKFTGSQIDIKNQIKAWSSEKSMCWKGYFTYKQMENKFCCLKMLKEPLNVMTFQKGKNYSKIYDEPDRFEGARFDLSHCREEDLIVMSKFRINLEGQEDIKMVSGGIKFLKEVMNKPGVSLGFIYKSNTKSDNFVEVLVDQKYAKSFQQTNKDDSQGGNVFTRYCYHFESLLTSIREFKALKALEFTRMAPILTYPTLSLQYKDKMLDDYCDVVANAFQTQGDAPELIPKTYWQDEEKSYHQMNHYLLSNHHLYNKSQARVLEQVIEMPKDDVLLIQGPPGTGKTHSIVGIISMIMSTRIKNSKQKIMVCAPSNAAIDQIIHRIIERGLIGLKDLKKRPDLRKDADKIKEEKKKGKDDDSSSDDDTYQNPDINQLLVRITSAEYSTESAIKKFTIEQKILKKLCIEKFGDLKKCIKELKDMQTQMNDFDSWEEYQDFPYCNKIKFKNYSKLLTSAYLKKVNNWGDVNLSREQQTNIMATQLKMHERELNDFKSGNSMEQGNMEWKQAEKAIISESSIICCTLSMAGSSKLSTFVNHFEYLIIDEACQSTEPSTLIPFQHAPKRVILVGDQKQLPATTFSGNSEKTGYCRSLFERLLDSGFDKTMLTIQFRMHPQIRAYPSEQFYGGAITDHSSIGTRSAPLTISNLARVFTSRIVFFDIQDSEEILDNKSKCNLQEADFTKILVDFMARKMSLQGTLKYAAGQIGVISPYKAQVRQLFSRLEKLCVEQTCNIHETIDVNTVDAFQGSEKDIIIFNCVRSNSEEQIEKSLGFLLDERRLNVAITRPKFFLLIVGNAQTLRKSLLWDNLIAYCQSQGKYIQIKNQSQYECMTDLKKHVLPQFLDGDFV